MTATAIPMILLVDDNDADVELTERALARAHTPPHVERVRDGEQALLYLKTRTPSSTAPLPDLILIEVSLTRLTSLDLIWSIKDDPNTRLIPIVLLTTFTNTVVVGAYRKLGVTDMLGKPISLPALQALLGKSLPNWR